MCSFLAPNLKGLGLIIWSPSLSRPYFPGQRFLRSVWIKFDTLHQDQVWSEDYARQIDFGYRSKWRPGGHLDSKHTWSRNTNWISFKLGAERKLGMANMYAHLFSVRFQKWRHGGHICLTPMITLFWPISRKLCKKFHLAWFSFTLKGQSRSQIFNGLFTIDDG